MVRVSCSELAMPTLPDNTDKFIDQARHAVFGQFDGGRMGKEGSDVFLKRLTYKIVQCARAFLRKVDHIWVDLDCLKDSWRCVKTHFVLFSLPSEARSMGLSSFQTPLLIMFGGTSRVG